MRLGEDLANLNTLRFQDERHGWALADHGHFWRTVDGGSSWTRYGTGLPSDARDIAFAGPSVAWAITDDGRVWTTQDTGHTWRPQTLPVPQLPAEATLTVWSPMEVDIQTREVGHQEELRRLYYTRDGGQTWGTHRLPNHPAVVLTPMARFEWRDRSLVRTPTPRGEPPASLPTASRAVFEACSPQYDLPRLRFADRNKGWLLISCRENTGDRLHLWRTDDGGLTWNQIIPTHPWFASQRPPGQFELESDSTQGLWIVSPCCGDSPLGIWSADEGSTWTDIGDPFTGATHRTTRFLGPGSFLLRTGLHTDSNKEWHLTLDSGRTWHKVPSALSSEFGKEEDLDNRRRVYPVPPVRLQGRTVYILKWGELHRSIDAGKTWARVLGHRSQWRADVRGLHFFDGTRGVAASMGGWVFSTEDGGHNWTPVAVADDGPWAPTRAAFDGANPLGSSGIPREVGGHLHFLDDRHGWLVGNTSSHRTIDGGKNWTRVGPGDFNAISFLSPSQGWAFSDQSFLLYRTDDAGATYYPVSPPRACCGPIAALAPDHLVFAGLYSSNGGLVWQVAADPHGYDPTTFEVSTSAMQFFDTRRGVRVVKPGHAPDLAHRLYATDDGGRSWRDNGPLPSNIYGVSAIGFASPSVGWVVGKDGMIFRTEDGGRRWTQQASGTKRHLLSVRALDERRAVVGAEDGLMLFTTTGGQ